MAVLTGTERLGITASEDAQWVELRPERSSEDVDVVIRAVYRQVLGNAYVMESERLVVPESQLKQGEITVREFVRQVAKSELYRSRFVDGCNRYRTIELNFKHLLGRAPHDYSEMTNHSANWDQGGFEADIDSYIDSLEYQENFGENIVPYHRGFTTQVGQSNVGFSRMFQLFRGYASSDRAQKQNQGRLTWEIVKNVASPIRPASAGALAGLAVGNRGDLYRIRVMQAASPNSTVVRRSTTELLVPYEQLSSKLQQLNRQGKKVMSIAQA
jgi:phycocyanin-associated rod linker protein